MIKTGVVKCLLLGAVFGLVLLIVAVLITASVDMARFDVDLQRCAGICENNTMAFMGLSEGRCVCSPNLNVLFYYTLGG